MIKKKDTHKKSQTQEKKGWDPNVFPNLEKVSEEQDSGVTKKKLQQKPQWRFNRLLWLGSAEPSQQKPADQRASPTVCQST